MGEHFSQLSDWERTKIMVMTAERCSVRVIARTLQRSPSTVSREWGRNGHKDSYSAALAGKRARGRKHIRPRRLLARRAPARLHNGQAQTGLESTSCRGQTGEHIGKKFRLLRVARDDLREHLRSAARRLAYRANQGVASVA